MYKKIVLKYFILSLVYWFNVAIGMAENFGSNSHVEIGEGENFSSNSQIEVLEEEGFSQIFAEQKPLDKLQELIQDLNRNEPHKLSEGIKSLLKIMKPSIDIFRKGQKDINSSLFKDYNHEMVKIKGSCFGDHLKNVLCIEVEPIIDKMNGLIKAEKMLEIQRNELTEKALKKVNKKCIRINLKVAEYVEQTLHDITLLEEDLKLTKEGRFNLDKKNGRFLSRFLTLMKTHEIDRSLDSYYFPMLDAMIDYLTNGIEFQELILGLLMMKVVTIEMISYMEIIQQN